MMLVTAISSLEGEKKNKFSKMCWMGNTRIATKLVESGDGLKWKIQIKNGNGISIGVKEHGDEAAGLGKGMCSCLSCNKPILPG